MFVTIERKNARVNVLDNLYYLVPYREAFSDVTTLFIYIACVRFWLAETSLATIG